MVEEVVIVLRARDEITGVYKKTTASQQAFNKSTQDLRKTTQGAATAAEQLRAGLAAVGITAQQQAAPAFRHTSQEMREMDRLARSAGLSINSMSGAMGVSAQRARQMNRALTRSTAALGFISPTAATAVAQLENLFQVSGKTALVLGGLAVGSIAVGSALLGSTKAAISFETSFRGIKKTVEGTEEQFKSLERTNRDLSISLGTSVNAINKIGQAAGQLGIPIHNLAQFEQIVVELAAASDISSGQAALSFGGLIATLDLSIEQFDALTDQIVDLGNTFSTGEADIVAYMNRIAGAGSVIGLTEVELANIAATFASLRIPVEAGGTAIQKVFLAIQKAAVVGGEELQTFSKAIGVTTTEFRRLVAQDPFGAFSKFIDALVKDLPKAQIVLADLGLGNERTRRAFLTAAAAGDRLTEVTLRGNKANQEATARTQEFRKELDTTAGQLRILRATVVDLGIGIGNELLPVVNGAIGLVLEFADALKDVVSVAKTVNDALKFTIDLPDIPGIPGGLGKSEKKDFSFFDLGKDVLLGFQNIDLGPIHEGILITVDALDLAERGINAIGGTSDSTGSSVLTFADALATVAGDSDALASSIDGDLLSSLESIQDEAEAARDALFNIFREPTIEGKQLEFNVKNLQLALAELGSQGTLTPSMERDKEILDAQLKTARARLSTHRLQNDLTKIGTELTHGGLVSDLERNEALGIQLGLVDGILRSLDGISTTTIPVDMDLGEVEFALSTLEGILGPVTKEAQTIVLDVAGDEQATAALLRILALGEQVEEGFEITFTSSGIDALVDDIFKLISVLGLAIDTTNLLLFAQGLLQKQSAVKGLPFGPGTPGQPPPFVTPGPGDFTGAAKAAAKAIDPLKDGIITLAEALEFGFTAATAATAELSFETEKLAARYFRISVESIKLERAERKRNSQLEVGLRLAERDIEFRKELVNLQIDQAVAMAELRAVLEGTGLEGNIDTFAFAVQELGEEIIIAGESTAEAMQRLSQAATDAVQTQFDALFNKPTREEAQLGLQIAVAERDLSLLIRSGASDELIKAKEDEVRQIQNLLDVRRAEAEVIQATAVLADQTLLTQHAQFQQAQTLIGLIATETELLGDLNLRLGLEVLAMDSARGAVDAFKDALVIARDVVADNTLGPGPGQSRGFGAAAGGLVVEANFTINAETAEEIKKQINEDLDDALNQTALAGSNAGTGTL